jgi:D-alanine-D-alanine ligase-like ATP-grasp enzyme
MNKKLGELAAAAFRAVGGTVYARVDIRESSDGQLLCLEVNATCSVTYGGYFELSVNGGDSSMIAVWRQMIENKVQQLANK